MLVRVAAAPRGCTRALAIGLRVARMIRVPAPINVPSGLALCWKHVASPCHQQAEEGLAMTTKHLAFDSSLHRDVRDTLAAATLVVFVGVILLVCA